MVVGHVQSGKTSHYTGLICKAADAGYRLVVVLAGFHNSLRSQTQIRLEEGFVGFDKSAAAAQSGRARPVGVGEIDTAIRPDTITTRANDGDFKKSVAKTLAISPGDKPLLLVVKKNGPVLKNLIEWLRSVANAKDENGKPYMRDVPLLVIDDEADQGSVDTKDDAFDENGEPDPDHDPTVINKRIRTLLRLFEKSAYVGYTATPFANIFIHEGAKTDALGEDLFPRSFIVSLPMASNYVGPSRIFGEEDSSGEITPGIPITREVNDHAVSLDLTERQGWMPPRHDKTHVPLFEGSTVVPPSLGQAMRCFLLSIAARSARGQEKEHNSMLVHVTRFTAVQERVVEAIEEELAGIRRQLRYRPEPLFAHLSDLWKRDFGPTTRAVDAPDCPKVPWNEVRENLGAAIESVQVRTINGLAGEVLDYVNHREDGLNVIAVGGDKLSRGLTLEGLTVSYFLRASRMYDTLMQMGRWFGYRPGYLDLCRLYSTPDLIEWFGHIAFASDELREDFSRMAASGSTPREFGHRVRSHPLLMVTSRVKMRHGQLITVTFSGDISETINFRRDTASVVHNWNALQTLAERIKSEGIEPRRGIGPRSWIWGGVSADAVLEFLSSYKEHQAAQRCIPKLLAEYIRHEVTRDRLIDWTVQACAGGQRNEVSIGTIKVPLVERNWHDTGAIDREQLKREGQFRIRRLVNPVDEQAGMLPEAVDRALDETIRLWREDPERKRPTRPSGPSLRSLRSGTSGLLLIYPIDGSSGDRIEDPDAGHLVGFAVSFPRVSLEHASKVSYQVNNVYWQQEFGQESG